MNALACRGLCAGYEGVTVVHELDIHVERGEVVALLGSNGGGKTTTLLTLSGLLPRIAGTIEIAGRELRPARGVARGARAAIRSGLAHVPEDRSLFPGLTVAEHLRLVTRDRRSIDRALAPFPMLEMLADRRAGLLSGGEQQMLALARAVASRPSVLLIDEMSLGLAPIVIDQLLPLVREIAVDGDTGVLLVEQQVPAALAASDRAYVLARGRIVASGESSALAADSTVLQASYLGDD